MINSYRANVEVIRPGLFGDAPPGRDGSPTPRISGLQPDLSNPTVTFVKVGDRVVAKVPFMDIEKLGLRVGASWTSRLAQTCDQAWQLMQAKEHAVKILKVKGKTAVQLEAKLTEKGVGPVIAKQAVEDLKRDGLVSDEAIAEQLAEEEVGKGVAPSKVKERLRSVGVSEETATATLKRASGGKSETALAKAAAEQIIAKLPAKLAKGVKWRRVAAALQRRGFDEDVARSATRRVLGPEPE
jgi:SOS response regulatory protein OraA/RecX